jgi:hypothetical protein
VQKVYGYRAIDWGVQSPILAVTEGGTEWTQLTMGGPLVPKSHSLAVHVFVFVPDDDDGDAEARLSPISIGLAGVIGANRKATNWSSITSAASTIDALKLQGREYIHEVTQLTFG